MSVDVSPIIGIDEETRLILNSVKELMDRYSEGYWGRKDEDDEFPGEFLKEFFELGLGSALVPSDYGGAGLGIKQASLIAREINRCGGNAYFVYSQYYNTALINKCAGRKLKDWLYPMLTRENRRILSFALTEPEVGSDSTRIKTFAKKEGSRFIISGHKIFISRAAHTDFMILVARTRSYEEVQRKTDGITLFLIDVREARGIEMRRIRTMANTDAYELFINNLEVPESMVIGEVDNGFKCLFWLLNPERIMVSAQMIGNTEWFMNKAIDYARSRVVFNRPIGQNQGIQFPLAQAYIQLVSSTLAFKYAAELHDSGTDARTVGTYANIAKYLSAETAWFAGNVAMDIFGGLGYAKEVGIERKLRETRLYIIAPISRNLILADIAHHELKLPRSF